MSKHPRADLYRQERMNGLTYRDIAKKYGVSYQAVQIACSQHKGYGFVPFTKKTCVYPNLRKWLNDNKVSMRDFVRRCNLTPHGVTSQRYKDYVTGRCYPSKQTIDVLLKVTGLTYEQFFEVDADE